MNLTADGDSAKTYKGKALIADPIYQYIWFTVPSSDIPEETTEQDLIDSPWMQRMRRIYQLQSARWVYPAAEHTRFQHSLGTMHMAGDFGRYLYPSLRAIFPDIPSINYVEELLRIGGLLHDVGHGPYGHFFDDNFLDRYGMTHEVLGQHIIRKKLGRIIKGIRRSPTGPFEAGESLDPRSVAFLIRKPGERGDGKHPGWLRSLQQLFSGIYTVDNLDYVQRDAYMTGFSIDIVDIKRLCFYTFFTSDGLTLHQAGTSALSRFLNARLNLYTNVYYHRTTRALDLHLQEIFRDTMNLIIPADPVENLGRYLHVDEWSLYSIIQTWLTGNDERKKNLAREWEKIYLRRVKWKMSYSTELSVDQIQRGVSFSDARDYERQIRKNLPRSLRTMQFKVDLATQDPRPINPMVEGNKKITVFNPSTESTSWEPLRDLYRFIPARVVHFRVFSLNHNHDKELVRASEKVLCSLDDAVTTNV
ncbi:MAG TPA: HD domain-containing protein [Deltaproteobacteria bacterium]|nr:HD domain-containing protein [Deltaproteobacteria bacterium]